MNIFLILLLILFLCLLVSNLLLLIYLIIQVKFITKNLPTGCTGSQNFDPTKKYTASFVFPDFIANNTKTKSISGTISGKRKTLNEGTFTITFSSYPQDGGKVETTEFPNQSYTYTKSTCKINFKFFEPTDGSKGVIDYLKQYHIDLSPYVADLIENDGIRLTGKFSLGILNVPLMVTAYPS